MGKLEANKQQKLTSLLNTAFNLFTTQGVTKTSIAEISQKAGIAKGTFYLYFKDKYDIRNRLISHESSKLLSLIHIFFAGTIPRAVVSPDTNPIEPAVVRNTR